MKVILKQSYMNLGEIGEIVDVKPGYACNYLIPQGIAKRSTAANLRVLEDQAAKLAEQKAKDRSTAETLIKQIEGLSLKIVKKVSEDGRLYGSVTTTEVEEAFAAQGVTIDRRQVVLGQQIKMVGEYSLLIKLFGGLKANVPLVVEGDGKKRAAYEEEEQYEEEYADSHSNDRSEDGDVHAPQAKSSETPEA